MSPLDTKPAEPGTATVDPAPSASGPWGSLRRFSPWTRVVLGLLPALLPALLFLPMVLSPPMNHDVAAVLAFTQRWLGGEKLYSELIDVNPPLIFIVNLIPSALAEWTPLDGVTALRLCVLALGGCCWFLSVRVRDRVAEGSVERAFLDVLPAFFLLGGGYDFAQREHLMAVTALPYLLCAGARAGGRKPRGRFAIAAIAAVGFALKPHFLGIPVLVELLVLWARVPAGTPARAIGRGLGRALRQSLRDPVPWIMAGLWIVYLASVPVFFGDYLFVVVPLVWDFYVGLGGLTAMQVVLVPRMATAMLLFLPGLWCAFRWSGDRLGTPGAALTRLFAIAGLGAAAAAIAQHKGWSYHIVPLELFACGLAGLTAALWLDRRPTTAAEGTRVAALLGALCTLYIVSNGEAPWKQLDYVGSEVDGLTQLMAKDAAGERVLVLSPGIYPIYPAVNYAAVTVTLRTMNVWLLQAAYERCLPDGRRYRDVWDMGRAEFFVYRTVAEDFARTPPAAVVVDLRPGIPWCGEEFSFIGYFSRHPLFAEVWSHYKLTGEWDRFRVYTRQD